MVTKASDLKARYPKLYAHEVRTIIDTESGIEVVPFEEAEKLPGWTAWARGITCVSGGVYLSDVETFLEGGARRRQGMNWQPIETAPKDGTRILAYFPGNSDPELFINASISVAAWRECSPQINWEPVDEEKELWRRSWQTPAFFEAEDGIRADPTHWMPLPDPPTGNAAGQKEGM